MTSQTLQNLLKFTTEEGIRVHTLRAEKEISIFEASAIVRREKLQKELDAALEYNDWRRVYPILEYLISQIKH